MSTWGQNKDGLVEYDPITMCTNFKLIICTQFLMKYPQEP